MVRGDAGNAVMGRRLTVVRGDAGNADVGRRLGSPGRGVEYGDGAAKSVGSVFITCPGKTNVFASMRASRSDGGTVERKESTSCSSAS